MHPTLISVRSRPALAFTIVARNYLAYASVLAESFSAHHDGRRLKVFVFDDIEREVQSSEQFDVLRPEDLPLELAEYHRMAAIYDTMELATALKPWVFRYLFSTGAASVIYLDPDTRLFAPIDDIATLACQHGIVLTPHLLEPGPRDGRTPGETHILQAGVFNLGFIAVGSDGSDAFLDWWSERLRRDCINDHRSGYFVDQKWIDLVPGYFGAYILKERGFNVAYWNLATRHVERTVRGWRVDGAPLRMFHFSGFDPELPEVLSRHQLEDARVVPRVNPALAELCRQYADDLLRAGYRQWKAVPVAFETMGTGVALDTRMRALYRAQLEEAERRRIELPPDVFTPLGGRAFVRWLNAPARAGSAVSRYLQRVWAERPDLQAAFPDVHGGDSARFLEWIRGDGRTNPPIAPEMLAPAFASPVDRPAVPRPLREGVNVFGYVNAESGTGQIARGVIEILRAASIPHAVIPLTSTPSRQNAGAEPPSEDAAVPFDTNIICVNADMLPLFAEEHREAVERRYNIGIWAWETEQMPPRMAAAAELIDEVWGISEFTAGALHLSISRPVHAFPLPAVTPEVSAKGRDELGVPSGVVFLFCFDFLSVFARKNPLGVIEAFRQAFPAQGAATLFIKSVNGERRPVELEALRRAAANRSDIVISDGYLDAADYAALVRACDVYVSLHRAEGFGLTIAEAMLMGKPVITTAYGAPVEFCDTRTAIMIPWTAARVGAGSLPYLEDTHWAEPDLGAAARAMARLVAEPELRSSLGAAAAEHMAARHSPDARVPLMLERLSAARRRSLARNDRRRTTLPVHDAVEPMEEPQENMTSQLREMLSVHPNPLLPSRFPRVAAMGRRLMLRLMRNYWVGQKEIDGGLLQAIQALESRIVQLSDAHRADLARLADAANESSWRIHELENAVRSTREELADVTEAVAAGAREGTQAAYDRVTAQLAELQQRLGRAESGIEQLRLHESRDTADFPVSAGLAQAPRIPVSSPHSSPTPANRVIDDLIAPDAVPPRARLDREVAVDKKIHG